jgi:hypothetical protein
MPCGGAAFATSITAQGARTRTRAPCGGATASQRALSRRGRPLASPRAPPAAGHAEGRHWPGLSLEYARAPLAGARLTGSLTEEGRGRSVAA